MKADRLNRWRYNLYAPGYDWFMRRFARAARRAAIESLAVRPGERVLIVGCGTGLDLEFLPAHATVAGLDVSAGMLRRAQAEAARLGRTADLRVGDARELPYPDDSFDVAVLHLILAVAPEPERIAAETARVLRAGGRASVFDKFLPARAEAGWLRRAANVVARALATDLNRRAEPILAAGGFRIERDEAALGGGLFRRIVVAKP